MSVNSEIQKFNNKELARAKDRGELLYRQMFFNTQNACVACGCRLVHDHYYKGIGFQMTCDCAKWQFDERHKGYVKVEDISDAKS